jgi:hypothetical protein
MTIGSGGVLVELLKDSAMPLLARHAAGRRPRCADCEAFSLLDGWSRAAEVADPSPLPRGDPGIAQFAADNAGCDLPSSTSTR